MTGPRFVPFESMSDAEQREHLRRVHGWRMAAGWDRQARQTAHRYDPSPEPLIRPHTHDKPAPRPEENR